MIALEGFALAHASEARFLLRLWLSRLLPILLLSIAADLTGYVWLMSVVGALCLAYLFWTYRHHKELVGLLHLPESNAKPVDWLILASLAIVAQATTNLHLMVATDPSHPSVWAVLGQKSVFVDVGMVAAMALLTILTGYAFKVKHRVFEKAFRGMATFEFIQNLATLVSGIWGAVALTAAIGTLQVPVRTWLQQGSAAAIWSAVVDSLQRERESAMTLYGEQNQYLFFGMFLFAPLAWLAIDVPRWLSTQSPRPDIWGRGWVTCAALVLAVGSVAVVSGAVWRYPSVAVLGAFGEPRDKAMAGCLLGAKDSPSEIACLQPWEAGWYAEMDGLIKDVLPRLSPQVRSELMAAQARFEKTYIHDVKPANDGWYELFNAVFARGTNVRNRTRQMRKAVAE